MTFKYYESFPSLDVAEVFCAQIDPEINTGSELLKSLYYLLWFPGYFGFNWDALSDCLSDFHWVDIKQVVIIHRQVPTFLGDELGIYLGILNDAIVSWENDSSHNLDVYFKLEDKQRIEEILQVSK